MDWAAATAPDLMGVQELKAQAPDLAGRFETVAGLQGHFHCAEKKGYSGVGLYSRVAPSEVRIGLGAADPSGEFDAEGRWVELRFDGAGQAHGFGKLSIISCYFPSGSSSEERQQAKFRFLDRMAPLLRALAAEREFILVGDVNIAHREIDLKNWKGNLKNSGFLPEERAWMDALLRPAAEGGGGLVDVHRMLRPEDGGEAYTWWSNRGQAWANNVGWRLDYHLATPALAALARTESIHKASRFSDHAPITVGYDLALGAPAKAAR